ncbi:MAG: glycosyltransferase family 4 protein [bacterium]
MRIGIVTQSYLPIHGGVAEHAHHTAVELRRRGHDVKIITAYFDRGDENFNDGVYRIGHDVTIPMNGAFVNITVGTRLGRQLREIESAERFDLVHIHSPFEPVLPMIALRTIRAPKVGTFHSYTERSFGYRILGSCLRAKIASRLSARIAVSSAARDFVSRYFPGEYQIIPNGVDVERFSPAQPPLEKFNDGSDNILFVGRMDPRKGLKYLLQAFPAIVQACPRARLIIVGGGFLVGYYRRFVKDEIRSRVFFEGFASAEKLPRYYTTASVYCSPATSGESFGIVLIEALASGVPVVAFDNRGYHAILGGDQPAGVLVENKSAGALAQALIQLLQDQQHRVALGRRGREKAEQYSWKRVTDQIEAVYRRVLANRS